MQLQHNVRSSCSQTTILIALLFFRKSILLYLRTSLIIITIIHIIQSKIINFKIICKQAPSVQLVSTTNIYLVMHIYNQVVPYATFSKEEEESVAAMHRFSMTQKHLTAKRRNDD